MKKLQKFIKDNKIDNRTIIVGILAVLGIVLGMYLTTTPETRPSTEDVVYNPSQDKELEEALLKEQAEEERLKSLIIIYENGKFTPQELTIKASDLVTWKSSKAEGMWIAADPHPSHTSLPELDQQSVSTDIFKFRFDKPGTYTYHNHINPSAKGKIIVEE